jgi:adenylate kinase family enzyme
MIKLVELLKEIQNNKKAIIMAGSAGVGKGTFIKDIESKYPQVKSLNPDNFFNTKLKEKGISLDLKNAFKTDRENAAKAGQAMSSARDEYEKEIKSSLNNPILIFDITSNAYDPILKLKTRLEENGYKVMMVYLFAPLSTVLDRNDKRFEKSGGKDRSLLPTIVVDTWTGVVKNFNNYQNLFGDNFIATTTDNISLSSSFEDLKKKYIDPYNVDKKIITLPKDVEEDFNEKIKSLGSLNSFEIEKLKEKALDFYTKNNKFMPLEKQGRLNGFKKNLTTIRKQSEDRKKETKEFLELLKPNNPTIQNIIKNSKTKDETLDKINTFLKQ